MRPRRAHRPREAANEGVLASSVDLVVKDDGEAGDGDSTDAERAFARDREGWVSATLRFDVHECLDEAKVRPSIESELALHSEGLHRTADASAAKETEYLLRRPQWREPASVAEGLDDDPAPPVRLCGASGRFATFGPVDDAEVVGERGIGGLAAVEETKGRCGHGELPGSGGESRRQDVPPGNS